MLKKLLELLIKEHGFTTVLATISDIADKRGFPYYKQLSKELDEVVEKLESEL
jgi:hypothetical protein